MRQMRQPVPSDYHAIPCKPSAIFSWPSSYHSLATQDVLEGHYKGFFIDREFKLLDYLGCTGDKSRTLPRDMAESSLASELPPPLNRRRLGSHWSMMLRSLINRKIDFLCRLQTFCGNWTSWAKPYDANGTDGFLSGLRGS